MIGTLSPNTPLTEVRGELGLQSKAFKALEHLGVHRVSDLLHHYPRRYEDRTRFDFLPTGASDKAVCLRVEVMDCQLKRIRGRRTIFEATVEGGGGAGELSLSLVLRWFNVPFMNRVIAVGQELVVYGKTKQSGRRLVMDHPELEVLEAEGESARIHVDRLTPIYPLSSGINQRTLRRVQHQVLEALTDEVLPDLLPEGIQGEMTRAAAMRQCHFPDNRESLRGARRYLALEEFTALQLNVLLRRLEHDARGGTARIAEGRLLDQLLQSLPFSLTGAQHRAIGEIRDDLAAARPMNRLLQGDVGSGKTLVALAAMLLAVEAGYQAALMAPTQILAEQHYLGIHRLLEPLGIRVSLRTSNRKEDGFLPLLSGGEAPQITVGTHALIHEGVDFDKLGLVVVDEQHKFGVAQRGKLIDQGEAPDVLVMTATPIPRTLTLSIYGDLDVSIIDEMPANRGKIVTGVREISKTEDAAAFVRSQLEEGRQAYIVYPLIEESDKLKSLAATVEFEKWEKRFASHRCGLLHGRIPAEEKEALMKDFREGRIHVLVATTVVEVGVDVPNASVMLIYNAERFGLAQLHQLRGRIGRGEHKSYCVLMVDPKKVEAREKLQVMEETSDGFRIAEADLKLRGPGEVLGTAQSGLPDLRMGDLVTDVDLVQEARLLATDLLEKDPALEGEGTRRLIDRFARAPQSQVQLS